MQTAIEANEVVVKSEDESSERQEPQLEELQQQHEQQQPQAVDECNSSNVGEDAFTNDETPFEFKFEDRTVDDGQTSKTEFNDESDVNEEDEDEDDDEDDVQVTIGDIKSTTPPSSSYNSYAPVNLNIGKRGPAFGPGGQVTNAASAAKGKASGLDIDAVGLYNGGSIYDLNLDALEEKPWRKPGADITDYFNYGFTEETWKIYCERQKKLRIELIGGGPSPSTDPNVSAASSSKPFGSQTPTKVSDLPIPLASVNENSKYSGMGMTKKAGPPPGRKPSGTIDVIGGGTPNTPSVLPSRRPPDTKENYIQVIGNRPPGPPGPGMPPNHPPFGIPPPPFNMPPPPGMEFPPGMPPPHGLHHPPLMPNGQPIPFPPGIDFCPPRFPHAGMPPNMNQDGNNYEGDEVNYGENEERNNSEGGGRRDRERDRESRDYHHTHHNHRGNRGYNHSRDYRDESYRRDHHHHREQFEASQEKSRDRESKEYEASSRRHRDREREKERDREKDSEHRERDREYRDRDSRDESRRRHRDYEDEERSRSSSSSRHKHSKRSKREKEEEEESAAKH